MTPTVTIQRAATVGILVTAAAGLTVALAAPPLPPVTDRAEVRPAFIASTARVLAPSVAAGAVEVRPSVIASSAAVRAPSVQPGAVSVQPAVIASTAQVRAPTIEALAPGAAEVRPAVIASTVSVPAPAVQPGAVSVAPALVASTASVFAPAVQPGSVAVLPTVVGSTSAVFAPTIQAGASQIAPAIIASTAVVPSPAVQPGAVNVLPILLASTSLVRAPTLTIVSAGYDPDAQAAFNAMTVQPSATRAGLISDFIGGTKSDALWALIEWLSLRASHDVQAARLDLRNPSRASSVSGAASFTVDKGFMGDGASYLTTGVTNQGAALFMQNSGTLFSFVNVAGNGPLVGASSNTFLRTGTGNTQDGRVNSGTNTSATASGPLGFACVSRTDASTQKHYRNGQLLATGTAASATAAMNEIRFYQASGIGTFAGRTALEGFGAGMTDAQIAALNTRVQTLINTIGAN